MEETVKILKSCIVARKGGMPQDELDNEYFKHTGEYIPYLRLGYKSLYEFLGSVENLKKKRNDEQKIVYVVSEPNVAHITKLVENQRYSYDSIRWPKNRLPEATTPRKTWAPKRKANNEWRRPRNNAKRRQTILNRCTRFSDESVDEDEISDYIRWQDEEGNHPVTIIERPQKLSGVCEPIVNGRQLIGDDFFLQLAIRNLGLPIWRNGPCSALHVGMCKSGQTIRDCLKTLRKIEVVTNKVVVMLGAEDVYRGRTSDEMISDMQDLIEYLEEQFSLRRSSISLCTVPPLANFAMHSDKSKMGVLRHFNDWIRSQCEISFNEAWNSGVRCNLIDFHTKNTTARGYTDYKFFQMDARMVSGTSHPYVLWSLRGRRLAMNLLHSGT